MEETNKYHEYAELPRKSDRTKGHMVLIKELQKYYPDVSDYNKEILNYSLEILNERKADLRRGDLIFLENILGGEIDDYDDYITCGVYIYDGNIIIDLNYYAMEESGFIPEQFQVGLEFPLRYWSDILNEYVPFNFSKNLCNIGIENFQILQREDKEHTLVIPFVGYDNNIFYIVSVYILKDNENIRSVMEKYLEYLKHKKYFECYTTFMDYKLYFLSDIPGISKDNILYLSNYETEFEHLQFPQLDVIDLERALNTKNIIEITNI